MTAQSAWKTQHPDALATFRDWKARLLAQNKVAHEIDAKAPGGRSVMVRKSGVFGREICGLSTVEEDNPRGAPVTRDDMPGWRLGAREGYWVPDRRTAAGKALAASFREGIVRKPRFEGMPGEVMTSGAIHSPGADEHDGWLYLSWGIPADKVTGEGDDADVVKRRGGGSVDESIWTPIRMSEWHAMIEARADEQEAADA